MLYKEILKCRICGNTDLVSILDLGDMALTGVFPLPSEQVDSGPLELVKCFGENNCGLVQLKHTYELSKLYGENYGYRTSLNSSMVNHIKDLVTKVKSIVPIKSGDLVIDIASNDGTLLNSYNDSSLALFGIDPTANKFKDFYLPHVRSVSDFFSSEIVKRNYNQKAKVVTAIAMFYDLEDPTDFMKQVVDILDDEGIFMIELSYMPTMVENLAYDTVCHEHLEYYALKQIKWMADAVGLKIIDLEFNDTNGGSFGVVMSKNKSSFVEATKKTQEIVDSENVRGFNSLSVYEDFKNRVLKHRDELVDLVSKINKDGKKIFGYGASTKGNVILQFCNFTTKDIPFISEVNDYKYGRVTPGTNIPIISEAEASKMSPDYLLVLPWHFKNNILKKEKKYLDNGGKLLFPLPDISIQ